MTDAVQQVFNDTAATYDADRARLIPGFNHFYTSALDLIPSNATRILDLGAGTGLFSAFIRERLPHAHLHLIDSAEAMLAKARQRFVGDPNMYYELADYAAVPLGSGYDAIVSALSIHHLEDTGKRALFARIFTALKPGGVFINAEQILASTPEQERAAQQAWLAEVHRLGATSSQIEESLLRQREDRCATITDQVAWFKHVGFSQSSCVYAHGRFAVISGSRR